MRGLTFELNVTSLNFIYILYKKTDDRKAQAIKLDRTDINWTYIGMDF